MVVRQINGKGNVLGGIVHVDATDLVRLETDDSDGAVFEAILDILGDHDCVQRGPKHFRVAGTEEGGGGCACVCV